MVMEANLYTHSFSEEQKIKIESIDHKNSYDFSVPHRHNYYEIFLFEKGGGTQIIDFLEIPVYDNSVQIVPPAMVHLLKRKPTSSGYVIQFQKDFLLKCDKKIVSLLFSNPLGFANFQVDKKDFVKLYEIVKQVDQVLPNKERFSETIALHYLNIVFYYLIPSELEKIEQKVKSDILMQFFQLLESNYLGKRDVKYYADALNISTRKLSEEIKKHFGKKTIELIHDRLLLEIKRLLVLDTMNFKEISYYLNFESPVSFTKFIKLKTGFTPSELIVSLAQIHK
jgi:AraC family transcriptional regulator, transcriptional activator of pobA